MNRGKKQPKNWIIYSGLAFQIGVTMFLMIKFGKWFIKKFEIDSNLPLIFTNFIGLILILFLIKKQSNKL
tara:strand:- start:953 stop:1162 length:210 start_codon:yes stop_codon:yes gene_type:complete